MTTKRALRVNTSDNVVTVLAALDPGEAVLVMERDGSSFDLVVHDPIPFGHKAAVTAISRGQDVIKYGESIGMATRQIERGEHVHVHNLDSKRGKA